MNRFRNTRIESDRPKLIRTGLVVLLGLSLSYVGSGQQVLETGGEYLRSKGKNYSTTKWAVRAEQIDIRNAYSAGITYQLASKKSYSVSRGFGLYLGYRYAFGKNYLKGNYPFAGGRLLFSFENFEGQTRRNSLLITPWAEGGYHLTIAQRFYTAPSLGYGFTFKFTKDYHSLDEDVGRRLLPSVSAGYRFR
ncbi:MAG: hypothetical protein RJA57_1622 [Bacteroidota bacterium]